MMSKRILILLSILAIAITVVVGQAKKSTPKSAVAAPDKAYLQKIWDDWSTLNPDNAAAYYASGSHTFFDIAPLKYSSWDEYNNGVKTIVAGYKSARFTLNDDVAIHPEGDLAWATATVAEEMTTKAGKVEMGNFRWTVIFENQDGKWKIVHEHVSAPLQ